MLESISKQLKELIRLPFWRKVPNGSKHYAGKYLDGKAHYYYNENADERIYEGSFYYLGKYLYPPYGTATDYVSGIYRHNCKHGRWKFRHKRRGARKLLYVDYFEGRHNGIYRYKSSGNRKRNGDDTTLVIEMNDGHPCGSVTGNFSGEILTGRCDSDGRPDGTWTIDLSKTNLCRMEYEKWEHGSLVEAYSEDLTTGKRTYNTTSSILPFLRNFIHYDCLPLERLITKGSISWRGNFGEEKEREKVI